MTMRISDNGVDREMTADEETEFLAWQKRSFAKTKARADAQTAKDLARQAVLDKLGLNADEAQALLG